MNTLRHERQQLKANCEWKWIEEETNEGKNTVASLSLSLSLMSTYLLHSFRRSRMEKTIMQRARLLSLARLLITYSRVQSHEKWMNGSGSGSSNNNRQIRH
jgi:hypothetical protein